MHMRYNVFLSIDDSLLTWLSKKLLSLSYMYAILTYTAPGFLNGRTLILAKPIVLK